MKRASLYIFVITFLIRILSSVPALAYPTSVAATLDLDINQGTGGLAIAKSNRYLLVAHTDTLKSVDLGTFALATSQPHELTTEDGTEGNIKGLVYSAVTEKAYAAQDTGKQLSFSLNDITAIPSVTTIAADEVLGPSAIDDTGSSPIVYIGNSADQVVYEVTPASGTVTTIPLMASGTSPVTFTINDILYNSYNDTTYISTTIGWIFAIPSGAAVATTIVVDETKAASLVAMATNSTGSKLYAIDGISEDWFYIIDTSSNTVSGHKELDSNDNTEFKDIVVMQGPAGGIYYGYISGEKGITVFDTTNDTFVDVDPTGKAVGIEYSPISTSYYGYMVASADKYIYLSSGGGEISVITENPYITASTPVYYDSTPAVTDALRVGGKVAITFQSNTTGTYYFRANGDITQTGSLMTDVTGATSGTIDTVDTDKTVEFAYDTNSSILQEGDNIAFIFLTSSTSLVGRAGPIVTVDNPPPIVTLQSTGYGNGRVYVNFDRLTPVDMSYYNIYVDTDETTVRTKTTVASTATQPASGSTVTGVASGLTNGTTYYVAVEGVDATGNIGPRGYLLPSGLSASAVPEQTVGPAGLSGETGCSLQKDARAGGKSILMFALMMTASILFPLPLRERARVRGQKVHVPPSNSLPQGEGGFQRQSILFFIFTTLLLFFFLVPNLARAEEKSPQWWSSELKVGFWMPTNSSTKQFYDKCCNLDFMFDGGLLYKGRYGAEAGVGFMYKNGSAKGSASGTASQDSYTMIMVPMETNGVFRADFLENQIVVPYVKGGVDYIYFRESVQGSAIQGLKYGLHGIGGLQFLIEGIDTDSSLEDMGINDIYFVIEARYQWVNSFGKRGLNLSGMVYSAGILFEF